jgi:transposase InsO family protein
MKNVSSQPDDLALWRYGIISPLLHHCDNDPPLYAMIKELAQRTYYTPDGKQKRLSDDTIRSYLDRYNDGGVTALGNKLRNDKGSTSVPQQLQTILIDLRNNYPHLTFIRLLRMLIQEGQWDGAKPSRSSLYRFAVAHALIRTAVEVPTSVRSFEFPFFGDLWSADFLHGPKVRHGVHLYKAYLLAIIDDATRYIVVARFHLSEDTHCLLDDFMLAIRRFGVPKRLYTDNGAAFRSKHLQTVAAKLRVSLPHTPPYTPRGRGKIERFFRTLREGFLDGIGTTTLEQLNRALNQWIQKYNSTVHSMLGMSPLDRKLTDKGPALAQIAPTQNIDEIFFMEKRCKIASDGCVRLFKKRFEIKDAVVGTEIIVYYLPWNQDCIFIGPQREAIKPLDAIHNALRFDKPHRGQISTNNSGDK